MVAPARVKVRPDIPEAASIEIIDTNEAGASEYDRVAVRQLIPRSVIAV